MPNPNNYDNEDDWMAACVPMRIDEGDSQDQAVAVCMSMWREHNAEPKRGRIRADMEHVPMEYKAFPQAIKQVEGRTVTGFASIFGNVDSGNDRTWKGAFKKTIAERAGRVKHLWQHDMMNPPIAAIRDLREVGAADLPDELKKAYPDATGGLLVTREYLNTPRGDEVLAGIISGAVSEMSFGYDPIKYDFEGDEQKDGMTIRNLRECRLWDTSDVNWGMNEATIASKRSPATLIAELLSTIKAAQGLSPAALAKADIDAIKNAMDELKSILTAEPKSSEPPAVAVAPSLTEQEIAELKARWALLQRTINTYQSQ